MEVDVLAHFDHWQREGLDEDYEDQNAWPVVVRRARLISAVDYLQVTQIHFGGLHYILKTSFCIKQTAMVLNACIRLLFNCLFPYHRS
jgi:hypothetical protein